MGIHYEDIDCGTEENSEHGLAEYANAIPPYENSQLFA
jgi:hypothetical protein